MEKVQEVNTELDYLVNGAISEIKKNEFNKAYEIIINALTKYPNAPEPHNLLGIWFECKINRDLARKHYRAAYALDPTYQPAIKNLERICTIFAYEKKQIDFGEKDLLK